MRRTNLNRIILLFLVALIHGGFILFFVIKVEAVNVIAEQPVAVMKLTDLAEEIPPPPPPPPPPREPIPEPAENAVEAIAETMIETEEEPEDQVIVPPGTLTEAPPVRVEGTGDYLPMHQVSVAPKFSERDILRALVYPPIALRAGIEGTVYLELFIDKNGVIQRITTLKETPAGRGFGDAAKTAFQKLRCSPAEANGVPVAVRYRYPVRFTIKD